MIARNSTNGVGKRFNTLRDNDMGLLVYDMNAVVNYVKSHPRTKFHTEQKKYGHVDKWELALVVVSEGVTKDGVVYQNVMIGDVSCSCHGGIWPENKFKILWMAKRELCLPVVEAIEM